MVTEKTKTTLSPEGALNPVDALNPEGALNPAGGTLNPGIFRAYDIRGIVNENLTAQNIYQIGQALGTFALEAGDSCMTVARDGRESSPMLSHALCAGITSTGCDVIDLGLVPTPLLYYSTYVLNTKSGVMLTGSHNPQEYNGLKMMIGGATLSEENIQKIYHTIKANKVAQGAGQISKLDIAQHYSTRVCQDVKLRRKLKVIVDCGNGVAGSLVPQLYERLGCEVIPLFCEIDGRFPNHHPDPSQAANLQHLIDALKNSDADIGIAFDGDGDRLGVVTNKGSIIWADRQLMVFAKSILAKHPGAKIIYDVKCTNLLDKVIRENGGEPIMWKTGHSLIKSKLAETQALVAGEMSGHIFLKDRWFGFDDAIYAGSRLLEILAQSDGDSHALFEDIPNSINTPELKIYVNESEKFQIMQDVVTKANFVDGENVTLDGLRVNFKSGWGLVRPSNTTPCLVLRFEAETELILNEIQELFRHLLLTVKPSLVLPF